MANLSMPGENAHIDAIFTRAIQASNAGRLAEAAAAYRQILVLRPDVAEASNNLGNVLKDQGRLEEAAAHYERAVTLKPILFGAHINLGNILRAQGKLDQAQARFETALALRPDLTDAYTHLGSILWRRGKLREAADQYQRAVELEPHLFQAHTNLGNILRQLGKLDEARREFERALALQPGLAQTHYNLGVVLWQQGRLAEAQTRFEQALALKPDIVAIHTHLAGVLRDQGKLDQALVRFKQAVALKPDLAESHSNLGNALKQQGNFDEALASFDRALALKPDYAAVHYYRMDLKTFHADDVDLAALESLASNPASLPPRQMLYVHFALGKAYEDAGDYRRAFANLLQGNALKRLDIHYNEEACRQEFQLVADRFDSELLDRFATAGDPSPVPIFILGMPRSGSTLVEQILASHPLVYGGGELQNLKRAAGSQKDLAGLPIPFPECIASVDTDGLRRMGESYLSSLPTLPGGKTRITDKMPSNFLYVGLIRLILPNARIIHTVRDPVDTCFSCFAKVFSDVTFNCDLGELGRYYRWYHELMDHWRSVLPPDAMLDVAYEDVVDNLEEQARRLIDYCGLPWDDRCLDFHKNNRPVVTASNVQVRQPIYRSSMARWRRFEPYLQRLLLELESCRQSE